MGEFEFEGPSHEEIWEKITSENVNVKLEGLLEAARIKSIEESDPAGSLVYLETALEICQSSGDLVSVSHVCMLMGYNHSRLNRYSDCLVDHELGAEAASRGMASALEIDHLAFAGRACRRLRDFDGMRRNFDLALKLAVETGHSGLVRLQAEYGRYLRKLGDLVGARVLLEAAYADSDGGASAKAAGELVRLMLAAGDVSGALEKAEEAFSAVSYMNDNRGMNAAQFLLAKAYVAGGFPKQAMKALDEIRERQKWGSIKHKVRVDVLYAEALMKDGLWDEALPLFNKTIPLLRKEKLWNDLGGALRSRSECYGVLSDMDGCANDLLAAVDAYSTSENLEEMCETLLELAHMSISAGDWVLAESYTGRIVDQVLMIFTPMYQNALGIYAIARVKRGFVQDAQVLVGRLGEVKGLDGVALAHYYHASSLLAEGVRAKNLAAKAVKQYLLTNRMWMGQGLAERM